MGCCISELSAFAAWIRRENRSRPTIVRALELRASYLLGVASQTVDYRQRVTELLKALIHNST